MANVKISQLPQTGSPSGTGLIPIVQDGTTYSATAADIAALGGGGSGTSGTSGAAGAAGTSGTSGGLGAVIVAGTGECSSVRDGVMNTAAGDYSFAGGGVGNIAGADNSFVGGGASNTILPASTITKTFPVTANTVNSFDLTGNVTNFFPTTVTPVTPPTLGESFGGGTISYILQPGDIGYDPLLYKVLILANTDQGSVYWGPNITTGATLSAFGTGAENTALIKSVYGDLPYNTYAAGLAASVADGGFSDWYLPSIDDLSKVYAYTGYIDAIFWSSTESDSDNAIFLAFFNGVIQPSVKSDPRTVRAVRTATYGPLNLYSGTDLVEATFKGTAGTSGVTLSDWGANFVYPTTYLTGNENIGVGPYDNVTLSFTDFGGEKSTIVGGQNNKVDGAYSFVGGAGGTVSSFGTSGSNTICQNADYSFIGAGGCNTIKPAGNVVSIDQTNFVYTGTYAGNYTCGISPCATSGAGTGLYANVTFCSNVPVSVTPAMSGSGYAIGDTVTFAGSNWTTAPAIGSSYGGGKVAYILQEGDDGYNPNFIKGYIAADADQGVIYWGPDNTATGATATALGTGSANTALIKSVYGDLPYNTYAAGLAASVTDGGYNDWYLPSTDELSKLYLNKDAIGGFLLDAYSASSEIDPSINAYIGFWDGSISQTPKNTPINVRAIRSFSISIVAENLTATIYEIDTVKNNAILGGFGNTIACASNAGVFGSSLTNTQANTFMANNFVVGDLAGNPGCGVALDATGKMCLAPGASPSPIVVGAGSNSLVGNSSQSNQATGACSAVYGGSGNVASCSWSFAGAGYTNVASGFIASVVGGLQNNATKDFGFVGGGTGNNAKSNYDVVVGGSGNYLDSPPIGGYSFIGSGQSNCMYSPYSAITGGTYNLIQYGSHNAIGGGCRNNIVGGYQTIPSYSFIGGGACNRVIANVCGYGAVLGGFNNCVTADYSGAFGCNIIASDACTFYVNNMCVCGTLYKSAGSFKISHPDPIKEQAGETLRHSFVESATAGDNIYRYSVTTSNGVATLELPDYYKFLNENDQVWVSPVGHFGSAYGTVNADQTAVDLVSNVDGEYNVLIIGTRKDKAATDAWAGINS